MDDDKEREGGILCAKGHKGRKSAEAPRAFVMWIVASCGSLDRERRGA